MSSFRNTHDFDTRVALCRAVCAKYPDRSPIIIEPRRHGLPRVDKTKYLVPHDFPSSQLLYLLRKRLNVLPSDALFVYTGSTLLSTSLTVRSLHAAHADPDGYLYLTYDFENTFGKGGSPATPPRRRGCRQRP
jgi:GABA(A) receptor-associated protein